MKNFWGTKVALFLGHELLVYQRDNIPTIPFPNMWDFPGGGREANENPFETARRETREEFGLTLSQSDIVFSKAYPSWRKAGVDWFFIAQRAASHALLIKFGNEGQSWKMMEANEFIEHHSAIPHLQERLKENLNVIAGQNAV